MARDADKRIRAWQVKFNTRRVKETLDDLREQMFVHVQAAFADLCSMEERVRQVLNQSDVPTILYVAYLDYARQLYKLSRQKNISGGSFARESQVLLEKWQGRSLDPEVLARVRHDVFDVPPDEEPGE